MERGMKSDTILLGAAAAVIALVVAFSMMDDKGSKKRSLEEMVEDVQEEVGTEVEGLKEAATEVKESVSKFQRVAEKLESKLPPDGRAGRALSTIRSGVNKAKPFVESAAAIIPDEVKEEVGAKMKSAAKGLGGRAFSYLREAAGKSFEQNKPKTGFFGSLFSPVKETPLPPGIRGGSR